MRTLLSVLLLILFYAAKTAQADSSWHSGSYPMQARVDITGEGKPEHINLESFAVKDETGRYGRHYFRLTVNSHTIYDSSPGSGAVQGFRLVNINKGDKWKEIQVTAPGFEGSDWNGSLIYWFNGRSIHRVIHKPLMWIRFPGDGRVQLDELVNGPITPVVTYDLLANHTLRRRIQKYYPVDVSMIVKEPFPIYSRPGLRRVAMLRTGTKVQLLKSDLGDWFYLCAGRRTYGWMNTRWNSMYPAFGIVAAG